MLERVCVRVCDGVCVCKGGGGVRQTPHSQLNKCLSIA